MLAKDVFLTESLTKSILEIDGGVLFKKLDEDIFPTETGQMSYSYLEIIKIIKDECSKITLIYSKKIDGRITSAVKENEYLTLLEEGLAKRYRTLRFQKQPSDRWWWDFRVNEIPFNLKLTTGGTDNAFNKVAIIYSLSGKEVDKKNMYYNQFIRTIREFPMKTERVQQTEYHYLVVNKNTGEILLKSIFDIHLFKSNPSNNLQINWAHEFKNINYTTPNINQAKNNLLKTIQTSVRKAIEGMKEFADADIDLITPL